MAWHVPAHIDNFIQGDCHHLLMIPGYAFNLVGKIRLTVSAEQLHQMETGGAQTSGGVSL